MIVDQRTLHETMIKKVTKVTFVVKSFLKVVNEDIFFQFAKALVIIRKLLYYVPKFQIINIKQLGNTAGTKTHSVRLSGEKIQSVKSFSAAQNFQSFYRKVAVSLGNNFNFAIFNKIYSPFFTSDLQNDFFRTNSQLLHKRSQFYQKVPAKRIFHDFNLLKYFEIHFHRNFVP